MTMMICLATMAERLAPDAKAHWAASADLLYQFRSQTRSGLQLILTERSSGIELVNFHNLFPTINTMLLVISTWVYTTKTSRIAP